MSGDGPPDTTERDAIRAEQNRPRTISDAAQRLLRESFAADMTQPALEGNLTEHGVLERARAAGFDFVSLTVDIESAAVHTAIDHIGLVRRYVAERATQFAFARGADDLLAARRSERTAVGIHFQDTDAINGNLDLVWIFRELGLSHMLLAYNRRSLAADGCAEPTDAGLSRFGRALVQEMRRAGVLCDGSHTGRRSSLEALELYDGPFIFSHSNCAAVFDHYRNVTDEQIVACAGTGGVIGINGSGRFLDDPYARAETMFRHVDHVASLVGWQHVGIGLDRMADPDRIWRWLHANAGMWPANRGRALQYATYAPHDAIGEVVDLMLARGYPPEAIRGYLGENFLRVLQAVWRFAGGAKVDMPVSSRTRA